MVTSGLAGYKSFNFLSVRGVNLKLQLLHGLRILSVLILDLGKSYICLYRVTAPNGSSVGMEPNMKISVLMDFGGIQPSKIAIIQEITAMAVNIFIKLPELP
jgi:hypothetical protein